jgi:hypothetical protein
VRSVIVGVITLACKGGIDVEGEVAVVEVDNVLLWSMPCGRDYASLGSHVVVKSEWWVTRVEGWWILPSCVASKGGVHQSLKHAAAITSNTVK